MDKIIIKGAREHNLKNISLEIPKNKLVVFSGVSGSGKSSLAFDTLYAEGQRRYVESLSSYARQFLRVSSRPEVDLIEGLSPSIAIDQKAISHNPRSTVGTITEIYDYLRLLYSKIGHPHCPSCGLEIRSLSLEEIEKLVEEEIELCLRLEGLAKVYLLAPLVRNQKGAFEKLFISLRKEGYEEARVDGYLLDLKKETNLLKNNRHQIAAVVDRFLINGSFKREKWRKRIYEAVKQALSLADGYLILSFLKNRSFDLISAIQSWEDKLYSQHYSCPQCNLAIDKLQPASFSFNSPLGACPQCHGLGVKMKIDTKKVPFWKARILEKRYYTTNSDFVREEIEKLMVRTPCLLCLGARLKKESLAVTILEKNIYQLACLSLKSLERWLFSLEEKLSWQKEKEIARPILKEIKTRLKFLLAVGLDYLDLARTAASLSTGEGQRIRLASQIGTGLTGVLYILDEPTVGLHPRDNQRLIKTLEKLRDLGNTAIIIEHDREVIAKADWIVDFGPMAGKKGGEVIASSTLEELKKNRKSLTGLYLAGKKKIPLFAKKKNLADKWLRIKGCSQYNLKNIDFNLPLKRFVCLTGVSGSGKSTLMAETLYPLCQKHLNPAYKGKIGKYKQVFGLEQIDRVLLVDQSPIGKTSRSNPATYTSVFTEIRELLSQTTEARARGFNKSYFSFNTKGGRCEACQGQGETRIEMQFLSDIWVKCEVCQGKRFKEEVLEVSWNNKNVYEILQMTIEEGLSFFTAFPKIVFKLEQLKAIGLEYLALGQPSPTLSGGESQRLKLARELVKGPKGNTLYLLDEPSVGLHFYDLEKLIKVLRTLVEKGNSVVVIEHNLDLIKNADWVIDLGPEGGDKGGYIVAQGKPEEIIKNEKSLTGKFLKNYL